jgi:hypothetical protein
MFANQQGTNQLATTNVNDIKTKPSKASILAFFLFPSETNLIYSKTSKDRSEANSA